MHKEDIIRMARKAGLAKHGLGWTCWEGQLERFAALVAASEREACAKVCDSNVHDTYIEGYTGAKHSARRECAAAIRARGQE